MTSIDIACDLHDRDETGYVWAYLDEARNPSLIVPGAIVIAGEPDAPAVVEVVDLAETPAGTLAHLRPLPGASRTICSSLNEPPPPPELLGVKAQAPLSTVGLPEQLSGGELLPPRADPGPS
ncbi:MAG: hypothetical protein ACYCXN_15325 [Acidimicrobiales bacterium]